MNGRVRGARAAVMAWLLAPLLGGLAASAAAALAPPAAPAGAAQPAAPFIPGPASAPTLAIPPTAAPPTSGPPNSPPNAAPPPAAGALDSSEDIRDIRGPKFVLPAWALPALIAGVLLLAALAYWAWRWWVGRRRPRALLPFEAALARLEHIRPLMQPQLAREFSTAVSDIVRGYIELRFEVTATHQTTEEFLHDLLQSSKASLLRHRALLSDFLHQCDLVKFAGLSLTAQNMESLHQSARAFVLETAKPEPEPAAAEAAPGGRTPPRSAGAAEAHDSLPST